MASISKNGTSPPRIGEVSGEAADGLEEKKISIALRLDQVEITTVI